MRDGTDRDMTRDLRPHPTRSEMPYVTSLTNVLHQTLGWHRARMTFMARFVLCSLQLTTTNLRRIAVSLKAGVEERSNYRRIRRFLAHYEVDYGALSRLLVRLVPQEPPYVLVLDRTEWHFGQTPVNVLMIGIAHRGIAFPIAWTTLPKSGGSGSEEQIEVLEAALCALDAEEVEALTADREFISVSWLKRLQAASIPFVIRLRSDRRLYRLGEEGPALPAKMYARGLAIGESRVVGLRRLSGAEEASVAVRVIVRRVGSDAQPLKDRFLVLATSGLDPTRGPALYRRRWEVETLFAALEVARLRPGDDPSHRSRSDPAPDRAPRRGVRLEPSRGREASRDPRTAASKSPRTPKPKPLSLRTRPAPGHPHHAPAATSGV